MKKTLIALAALAATGAFAQVKITGGIQAGFLASTATAGNTSGWGTDNAALQADVSEDLGGGMSMAATMGIQNLIRGGAYTALNSTVTLTTGVGAFTAGTIKSADFLNGFANVGGTYLTFDDNVTPTRAQGDIAKFDTKLGAVGISFQHQEADRVLGTGAEGQSAQRSNSITAVYSAGALKLGGGYVVYDNTEQATTGAFANVVRVGVQYDLGVAKLGAGYQSAKGGLATNKGSANAMSAGVTVPMGALNLSANWATTSVSDVAAGVDGTNSGVNVEARYDFSKNSNVLVGYQSYTDRSWTTFALNNGNKTKTVILLTKNF